MSAPELDPSSVTRLGQQMITIPLNVAQWLAGGMMVAFLSGGSAYLGTSSAASPEVVGLQIELLGNKVDELHKQVRTLEQGIRDNASTYLTRQEHREDLHELEQRVRKIEDQ